MAETPTERKNGGEAALRLRLHMREQSFIKGALIISVGGIVAKILGAFYRIPLTNILGGEGAETGRERPRSCAARLSCLPRSGLQAVR